MPKLTKRVFLIYWLPVLIWLAVIFAESGLRIAAADQTSRFILPVLRFLFPSFSPDRLQELHHLVRKLGHFTGYGLLSYFFFRAWRGTHHVYHSTENLLTRAYRRTSPALSFSNYWRRNWALLAMVATFIVASCDEMHQMTLPYRTGSWWDVLLDCVGGLIFQIAVFLFWLWRSRNRQLATAQVGA